jgi:hypothetical protein
MLAQPGCSLWAAVSAARQRGMCHRIPPDDRLTVQPTAQILHGRPEMPTDTTANPTRLPTALRRPGERRSRLETHA